MSLAAVDSNSDAYDRVYAEVFGISAATGAGLGLRGESLQMAARRVRYAYLEEERAHRRPVTAHMLATGVVVLDLDPAVEALRKRAAGELHNPPAPTEQELIASRYTAALFLELDAGQAAIALENAQLFKQTEQERVKLSAIINSTQDAVLVS